MNKINKTKVEILKFKNLDCTSFRRILCRVVLTWRDLGFKAVTNYLSFSNMNENVLQFVLINIVIQK